MAQQGKNEKWLDELLTKIAKDFDKADTNPDGALTIGELSAFLAKAHLAKGGDGSLAKKIFATLGKDEKDAITCDEFANAVPSMSLLDKQELFLRRSFYDLDFDGDKKLTSGELLNASFFGNCSDLDDEQLAEVIQACDKDEDGLDIDEFIAIFKVKETAMIMHNVFQKLDKDNSGLLDLEEVKNVLETHPDLADFKEQLRALEKAQAKDSTGKIRYNEFVNAWRK